MFNTPERAAMQTAANVYPAANAAAVTVHHIPSAAKLAAAEKRDGVAHVAGGSVAVTPPPHGPPTVQWPRLQDERRTHVSTAQAAFYLCRAQQTMRTYAMTGHPIAPVRVNGRLAWPVAEIRRLLGVE